MKSNSVALTIPQFCEWANISRSHFYILVNDGRLSAVKTGKRVLILRSEAERWLASLPPADINISERAA